MSARSGLLAGAQALGAVMTAQCDAYRAMLALSVREQEAILRGDVEELTLIVDDQETHLDHLRALETERMTALVAIEAATGIDPDRATLAEVAASLPPEAAASLTRAGNDLRAQALALREAHEVNARLLRSSRALVDRWIQYLRTLLTGAVYGAQGAGAPLPGGRALDKSA